MSVSPRLRASQGRDDHFFISYAQNLHTALYSPEMIPFQEAFLNYPTPQITFASWFYGWYS